MWFKLSNQAQSPVTHILALRHGETDWNVAKRMQGHLDIPLNQNGLAQADVLAKALAQEPISAIYSSDLSRAAVTALPLAQLKDLPVHKTAQLRERHFGVFQGKTYSEIEGLLPQAFGLWRDRDPDFSAQDGESLRQLQTRIEAFMQEIAQRHAGQTVAIFSHGGVMDIIYRIANKVELHLPRSWVIPNAVINRITWDGQEFKMLAWGEALNLDSHEV